VFAKRREKSGGRRKWTKTQVFETSGQKKRIRFFNTDENNLAKRGKEKTGKNDPLCKFLRKNT